MPYSCLQCEIESDYPFDCDTYEELESHTTKCKYIEFVCKYCLSRDGIEAPRLNDYGMKDACNYCKEYVKKRKQIQDNIN
jgi:hypothetical protein